MLSNLEIIGWKKFRGQPKLDEAAGQVQFGCRRNFLNPIISKLDKHVVLLLINYIACEVIQLCKENYSNCLKKNRLGPWSSETWESFKNIRWSSENARDWHKSSEILGSVRVIFGNLRKCAGDLRKYTSDLWKSSKMFEWYSEIFRIVRVIFGNLRKCSGDL